MKVFNSVVAQNDNLGDLVLRRVGVEWAESLGDELHILVGNLPSSFVEALHLPAETFAYQSTWEWGRAALRAAATGQGSMVYSPGPQALDLSKASVSHAILNLIISTAMSKRSGKIVKIGRSLSPGDSTMLALERKLHKVSHLYTVRDFQSADLLAFAKDDVYPDLALGAGFLDRNVESSDREYVAFSLRGDERDGVHELLKRALRVCANLGLTPVFVTQVQRDNGFHDLLARHYDIDHVDWPATTTHEEQLNKVTDLYAKSAAVVTTRLHAALFGLIEGAIPVGLDPHGRTKMEDTFHVLGLSDFAYKLGSPDWGLDISEERSHQAQTALRQSRVRLERLRERL